MVRNRDLDGIRGIAILLVLIWHYVADQVRPDSDSFLQYLKPPLAITWSGVDLFFVLSGFLIVGILLDAKGSKFYFRTFYIRRACRILPLYLLMLSLFIIILLFVETPGVWLFSERLPLVSYFTFTQNFFMHKLGFGPNWLAVSWSLAIEEQFYLLIPILVWRLTKGQLFFVFMCLICMAPVFREIYGNLGAFVFPFARADSILMGGLLAIGVRTPNIKAYLIKNHEYLVTAFFISSIGIVLLTIRQTDGGDVFGHLLLGVFYGLLVAIFVFRTDDSENTVLSSRFLVWLGLRSYGIYLFHQPVSGIVHYYLNGSASPRFSNLSEFYATLVSLLVVLVLAEVSYRYFESIFLSYGRRYSFDQSNKS